MQFSAFPNKKVSTAKPLLLNRETFIRLFAEHSVRVEKDGRMFAPATFKGKRGNGTFLACYGLCLDFDHGQPDVEAVLGLFSGTLAGFYSTHSNIPEAPRFRVVIPLSRPVDAEEHALLVMGVKSIIPLDMKDCLDPSCFDRSRAHYLPSCPPEQKSHAFTGHQDGAPLDVDRFIRLGAAIAPVEAIAQREPAPAHTFEFVDHSTGEVVNLTAWAAQNPGFDIVAAIAPQYRRGSIKDGKQHIVCPFENHHTDQGADLATFVANASPPEHATWDVHCCHAHCTGRDRLEYLLTMLEDGWISADQLQAAAQERMDLKRPLFVNYPVNDILKAPDWSILRPPMRRIALDLMAMCWAEDDGMIEDNDWKISERLDLPEEDWKTVYRLNLTRAGWLIESNGRLTNSIVKREFDKAQKSYNDSIINGRKGGKASVAARK